MSKDEKVFITPEQAEKMIPDKPDIHTFRSAGFTLLGSDWSREQILEGFKKAKHIELSGESATAMKHGIAFLDEHGFVFVETRDKFEEALA